MLLPRRRVPVKSPTGACSFSITAARDFSVSYTCFKKIVPASVSTTPLLERTKRGTRSSSSRSLICLLTAVLSCTGPQSDYRKLNDALVQQLLVRDLLAPDPLRMGAYTAEGGYICNRGNQR